MTPPKSLMPNSTSPSRRSTQLSRLRSHFRVHPNEWISLPDLHQLSGSLNISVRIADLRHQGMCIENRVSRVMSHGQLATHSEYCYVPRHGDDAPTESPKPHQARA